MSFTPRQYSRKIWLDYIIGRWPIYALGALSVAFANISLVLWTRGLGWFIDFFSGKEIPSFFTKGTQLDTFYFVFAILLGTRVLLFFSRIGWRITLGRQSHHAGNYLKAKIYEHARFFKRYDLDSKFTKGVLMNASTSDVQAARFIFGFTLIALADMIFLGAITLWAMFQMHVIMSIWSLAALLVLPYFVKKLSSLEIERYASAQEYLSTFNDLASQVVSTIRLQRLTQTGSFWRRRLMDTAETYRNKRLKAVKTSLTYTPIMGGASLISFVVLFALGIYYVFAGSLSIGDFVAMQGLVFLLQDPLFELGFIISDYQKGSKSLERLSEIYLHPQESWLMQEQGRNTVSQEDVLEAKSLGFSYEEDVEIFSGINLQIRKNERLGIKGPIGSGKSTLVQVLAGLEREHAGSLNFLGDDFSQYAHETARDCVGMVPQKPFLFASSIRENISMDAKLSDEKIWHYLEVAGLADDVREFPDQLDTELGEWGINLSGGQKQRLTLARAIARKPQLLFLDDCLSAVDTVTEERILKNLDKELSETTLVWVAHRESTLKYCDRILEMKKEVHVGH